MQSERGAMGAGAIVSLVFGLLFAVGGAVALSEAYVAQSFLPGLLGDYVYLPGIVGLTVGALLIAVAAVLSRHKGRRKR